MSDRELHKYIQGLQEPVRIHLNSIMLHLKSFHQSHHGGNGSTLGKMSCLCKLLKGWLFGISTYIAREERYKDAVVHHHHWSALSCSPPSTLHHNTASNKELNSTAKTKHPLLSINQHLLTVPHHFTEGSEPG